MSWTFKKEDGDLVISESNGRLLSIRNEHKAAQDVADSFMTDYDPERNFGSELPKAPGEVPQTFGLGAFGSQIIRSHAEQAIRRLQEKQMEKPSKLSAGELIESIFDVRVIQSNKTDYLFHAKVKLQNIKEPRDFTFQISLKHQFSSESRRNLPGR